VRTRMPGGVGAELNTPAYPISGAEV